LDEAESIGIRKSYEALSEADFVLVVLDSTQELSAEDRELLDVSAKRRALAVANKSDLAPYGEPALADMKVFRTSAITGAGIDSLRAAILEEVAGHSVRGEHETGFLTNIRHQRLVEESLNCIEAACQAAKRSIPHEMIMLDLYGALRPLDAITGETTTDDILNLIFSSFCIGK
jgi:tRNA modification GTPase